MTEQILNFFGRFHPLVVHLPIGVLLLAFFFEGVSLFRKYRKLRVAVQPSLFVGAIAALISAITGYLLSLEGGYETDALSIHQYLGIATAVFAIALYFLRENRWVLARERQKKQPVRFYLFLPLVTMLTVTGHFGGSLTHGEEFITAFAFYTDEKKVDPIEKIQTIENTGDASLYADVIQPILESKCYSCHSTSKQKGNLRLDATEMIVKGGKHGPVIALGLADSSSLYSRLMLPLEDKHHMPPNEKPQPSSSEIDLIRLWINEGAKFEQRIKDLTEPQKADEYIKLLAESLNEKSWIPQEDISQAEIASVEALRNAGAIVVPVATDLPYLSVNYANTRSLDRTKLEHLLAVKDQLVSLRLSYCQLGDLDLSMLNTFDNLTWLYLDHTNITDSMINAIDLPNLKYLNVIFTSVTDRGLESINKLNSLEQLFVYQTKITADGIGKLRKKNPAIHVDTGDYQLPKLLSDTVVHKKRS